jgi:hypothetical protein
VVDILMKVNESGFSLTALLIVCAVKVKLSHHWPLWTSSLIEHIVACIRP